ncbi:hypothetical protein A0H81_14204 [Grifola frondosa]|uniref:Uncharacterized protein n=1 Tax=Grifola frondosa TaxID=5627 RepID=A0A1C7LN31_GRIFR|nr:hypothetical protein A0H81_14204 [Grifola frondosa]
MSEQREIRYLVGRDGRTGGLHLPHMPFALERHQFTRPLMSFQLVQTKLVDALTVVVLGLHASLQVRRFKDAVSSA